MQRAPESSNYHIYSTAIFKTKKEKKKIHSRKNIKNRKYSNHITHTN